MRPPPTATAFWSAYADSDRDLRVRHARAGCILVLLLMPAGLTLDYFVYPRLLNTFLVGRLLCDVAVLPPFLLLLTALGRRWIRVIGVLWPLLPAVCIAWMIAITQGAASPYYAGLNLVIIVACVLMPYTWPDAATVVVITLVLYVAACLFHQRNTHDAVVTADIFGNLYFMILTAIITITATHFFSIRRVEDFHLRHQLDERNKELNASYIKLEEVDRQRNQFFANISHELRTPLTLIIAPLQDLLAEREQFPRQVGAALDVAHRNGLRLLKLINDLLELVRIDSHTTPPRLEPLELTSFVHSVGESIRYLAEAKGLHLECTTSEVPLLVDADSSRLEKVVLNLLSNAIKFTPAHGRITLTCGQDAGRAVIEVADTGEGIPANDLPHIFERFRQVDGTSTRKYQGAGIGLSLVRELVEEHRGQIIATSDLGRGTRMRIELPTSAELLKSANGVQKLDPIAQIYHAAERSESLPSCIADDTSAGLEPMAPQGRADGQVVLVVDDEPDMRHYLVSRLVERFFVHQCGHGAAAVSLAKAIKPDLILLDLMLPGIDGLTICAQLRDDPALVDTRIILLTARMDETTKLTALRGGADDFLTKPFSTPEVVARVSTQLRTLDLQRNLRRRGDELHAALVDLRSTKIQLIHSEKMNALGVLSAGILHEVNNPLNFSLSALQVTRQLLPSDHEGREAIDDAIAGMQRIHRIVKELGAFAHKNSAQVRDIISVADVVGLARRLCASDLARVTVEIDIPADLRLRGSQTQLSQVLVNLLINAVHAVVDAGVSGRTPMITVAARSEPGHVLITVRDNGVGIKPEHLERIFEPFFTTRQVGSGWGLGLSICHTIITDHDGEIRVASEVDVGTEFTIRLPTVS